MRRWSPLHELVPEVPLRHGHAISIDMVYSATLAHERGLIKDDQYRRILGLFSRAGLSMDHKQFDEEILDKGTKAILKTRDGKLRAAVPAPLGQCVFLNDVSQDEMFNALRKHKEVMQGYPRRGEGIEAFVDSSDTGYTMNNKGNGPNGRKALNGHLHGSTVLRDDSAQTNGTNGTNGVTNGVNGHAKGINGHVNGTAKMSNAVAHASGPEGADGLQNGV